jgi:hypothetical protein
MFKKFLVVYKTPLLVSLTLAIVLIALRIPREPFTYVAVILGSFLGTFLLDLDYIIHAYFLEPATDFSKTLKAFLKHRDLGNAFSYIQYHRNSIKEKVLHSVLFQIVLAAISIYVVYAGPNVFIKALILSAFLNSLYRFAEHLFTDNLDEWFWSLKKKPTKDGAAVYAVALLGIFIFCLFLF